MKLLHVKLLAIVHVIVAILRLVISQKRTGSVTPWLTAMKGSDHGAIMRETKAVVGAINQEIAEHRREAQTASQKPAEGHETPRG